MDWAVLNRDPPDHTRLRSLANQAFTPGRVCSLEPRIAQIVMGLIERVRSKGGMAFIADFALPLPVIVIAELLGVPREDREIFRAWSLAVVTGVDAVRQDQEAVQRSRAALLALSDYFADLIGRRREATRDDLISALIAARDQGDRLTEDELLGTCILLLVAGQGARPVSRKYKSYIRRVIRFVPLPGTCECRPGLYQSLPESGQFS